jgi:hypothetical protein
MSYYGGYGGGGYYPQPAGYGGFYPGGAGGFPAYGGGYGGYGFPQGQQQPQQGQRQPFGYPQRVCGSGGFFFFSFLQNQSSLVASLRMARRKN